MTTELRNLSGVKNRVEQNEGVLSITMQEIRDEYGAMRLGSTVRNNITDTLHGQGIDHYPKQLPEYQDRWVILYKLGSPAEKLIEAILEPTEESSSQIRAALSSEAEVILKQIRELVCS